MRMERNGSGDVRAAAGLELTGLLAAILRVRKRNASARLQHREKHEILARKWSSAKVTIRGERGWVAVAS